MKMNFNWLNKSFDKSSMKITSRKKYLSAEPSRNDKPRYDIFFRIKYNQARSYTRQHYKNAVAASISNLHLNIITGVSQLQFIITRNY